MILVDANLLLHAYNRSSPQHDPAKLWLERSIGGVEPVRLAWITVLAFIRIATNPRAFPHPLLAPDAVDIVRDWLRRPSVDIVNPGERHWEILSDLVPRCQTRGPLVMDAHLAALAIEHGAVLYTTDQDFHRFPGLRWKNPL